MPCQRIPRSRPTTPPVITWGEIKCVNGYTRWRFSCRSAYTPYSIAHPNFFPSQQIGIKIKGDLFSCDVVPELIYSNRSNDITDYFERHFDIPPTEFDTIDWTCLNYTLRKHSKKRQLIKGLHHQWDTLGRNLWWNRIQNGECLLCGNDIEGWRHVLRCSNEHMIRKRNELVEQLKKC